MSGHGTTPPGVTDAATGETIESCSLCMAHFASNHWALREAFASVGIEHNKSSAEMAANYFAELHRREKHGD